MKASSRRLKTETFG